MSKVKDTNMKNWLSLPCSLQQLRLDITLVCGQSFRWKEVQKGEWRSVLRDKVWTLRQTENSIEYIIHDDDSEPLRTESENQQILRDYFQLDVDLVKIYNQWVTDDPNFRAKSEHFPGVRILRQDPIENLFSFICSSNNHINRIGSMVDKLCVNYGEFVAVVDGVDYYNFPRVDKLAGDRVEDDLRRLGFGYRAKYIGESARFIVKNGGAEKWLFALRDASYEDAHSRLTELCGVGAKVADCVCLMSLDKPGAIPVDTHVWKIACRDYRIKSLQTAKSLTQTIYKDIGEFFRKLWGEYAGWAQSVLFSAELRRFQELKKSSTTEKRKTNESTKIKRKRKK
ncbi:N-glycosylase/DNA lyase-like [Tubulanus polymorphus]|uniref:N-glycosylase/DNA lyase-like n=1 Tax=Tubulanus polymorphus TaxID=672921 RepID=UPI003DA4A3FB